MGKNFTVVVRVPVQNLNAEEVEELQADALGFLAEYDLWDEGTVEAINEVSS